MQESNSNKLLYKRLVVRLILAIVFLFFLVNIFPKLLKLFAPFIVALIIAVIVNPLVSKINRKLGKLKINSSVSRKIITLLITFLIIFLLTFFTFNIINLVVREVIGFLISIQENWHSIEVKFATLQENLNWLIDYLPQEVIVDLQGIEDSILSSISNITKTLISTIFSTTTTVISKTGTIFIALLTFFMALYFITSEFSDIYNSLKNSINKGVFDTFILLKNSVINATGGYVRAQLIIASIAFSFIFIALSIYGQSYAFVIALFLALVDLFPLIGVIAVLLPWGIIELLASNTNKGFFLIILGVGFFLFRRVVEPKVMGRQTGLNPLVALMSIYVGLQFSGIWGAILGPILVITVISIFRSGILDNTISDINHLYKLVSDMLNGSNQIS